MKGEPGTAVRLEVISPGQTESRICVRKRDATAAWLRETADLADPDPWRRKLREVTEILDVQNAQNILFRLSKTTYQTKKRHAASGDEIAARWVGLFEDVARHLTVVVE